MISDALTRQQPTETPQTLQSVCNKSNQRLRFCRLRGPKSREKDDSGQNNDSRRTEIVRSRTFTLDEQLYTLLCRVKSWDSFPTTGLKLGSPKRSGMPVNHWHSVNGKFSDMLFRTLDPRHLQYIIV